MKSKKTVKQLFVLKKQVDELQIKKRKLVREKIYKLTLCICLKAFEGAFLLMYNKSINQNFFMAKEINTTNSRYDT